MSAHFQFQGLQELREALRRLPNHLTEEAADIIHRAADELASEARAAYPTGPTGNLKRLVSVSKQRSGLVAGARVQNRAPHAYIFEHGTQVRHTDAGLNRGRMPPGRVWIPIAIRKRRQMWTAIRALLEREGLVVTGDAG